MSSLFPNLSRMFRSRSAGASLVAASAMSLLLGAGPAAAGVVYFNDFSSDATGFSGANSLQTSPDGTTFLGVLAAGGSAALTLSGLAPHTSVNLTFDLYALRSLDGDGQGCCGPDAFVVTLDDASVLVNHTFANFVGNNTQNYPVPGSAPGSGSVAFSADALGYGAYFGGAYTYRFSIDVPSSASSIKLSFIGNSDQPWNDEGFGIDNVQVMTNAIPEPSTYALVLAGLGLGGLLLRRRSRR